jgi:hypothetical protein
MKLYSAGNGYSPMIAKTVGGTRILTSYWGILEGHFTGVTAEGDPPYELQFLDEDSIVDSGLFSLMFGSSKGRLPITFDAYRDYTLKYIEDLQEWKYRGFFVESDVHRLLGMDAVFKLRELYKPFGRRVIHVWHMPEGLEGLDRLALEYDYIALSVPELRKLGKSWTVPILCRRIAQVCRDAGVALPRIHLLGGIVKDFVTSPIPYSADSTSWMAGAIYGLEQVFSPTSSRIYKTNRRTNSYAEMLARLQARYPELVKNIDDVSNSDGAVNQFYSKALGQQWMADYQEWLDCRLPVPNTRF